MNIKKVATSAIPAVTQDADNNYSSVDKMKWHPRLIPAAVVLISTYNIKGETNIAPKSWIQMVSFKPPILMFSGTEGNTTERNIIDKTGFKDFRI